MSAPNYSSSVTLGCSYELSVMNHLKSFMPTSSDNQQLSGHCSYRLPSAHEDDTGQSQSVRGRLRNSRSCSPSALLSVTKASTTPTLEWTMTNTLRFTCASHAPTAKYWSTACRYAELGNWLLSARYAATIVCRCWTSTAAATCSWCTSA